MAHSRVATRVRPGTLPDWLFIACGLSWGAGMIHVSAAIDHASESGLYTLFFALLAPVQLAWGFLMCRSSSRRVLLAGCALSLIVVFVWAMSRTTGVPIGPQPWRPESVGLTDSLATADELMIVLLAWSFGRSAAARRGRSALAVGAEVVGVMLILVSSLALLVAGHSS
jgi:hypothetical protein